MKRLIIFGSVIALIFSSCTKNLPDQDDNALREVIFNTSGSGLLKAEMDCSLTADYAIIEINSTIYTAATFVVNDVLYTQAIKLPPGQYTLEEFTLWNDNDTPDDTSDDIMVSAAPHDGAPFADMVINPLDYNFDIEAFLKVEVEVGVLCYEESNYDQFGFVWFKPNITHVKQKWFFGDLCSEIFVYYEGSLYGDNPKVDMPAIFQIEVFRDDDLDGTYETAMGTYNNESLYVDNETTVPPLSVPFIDRPGVEDRYLFKMYVWEIVGFDITTGDPVFEYKFYSNWYFTDDSNTMYEDPAYIVDPSGVDSFDSGADGVYDFVVGFCTYDGSDTDVPDPDDPEFEGCETAFAYGGPSIATCFGQFGFARWGWTNAINGATSSYYSLPIYAAAGQCDITAGTLVGNLIIEFTSSTTVDVTYQMDNGYTLDETHLYIGSFILPIKFGIYYTVAPGQFPEKHDGLGGIGSDTYSLTVPTGDLYIVAHAVVCGN